MLETGLIGAILGGVFRLAPEILKFFTSKSEMAHELEMFRLQTELEKVRGEMKIESEYVTHSTAHLEAIVESNKVDVELTKNNYRWITGFISLQRPYITFTVFTMYVAVKGILIAHGLGSGMFFIDVIREAWTENDVGILMMILNFHFVGRSIEKYRK